MGWLGLGISLVAGICVGLSHPGGLLAIGLGTAAMGVGVVGYGRREAPGTARLAGAAALAVGALVVIMGAGRFGITLAALRELERML